MQSIPTRKYSDFDLNFTSHPLTGDIITKLNDEAVKRAVLQLIMLNKFDKKYSPEIASSIREQLFEPMSIAPAIAIESKIRILLIQYEPRINLIDVKCSTNHTEDGYDVTITYNIINDINPIIQQIFLERVR